MTQNMTQGAIEKNMEYAYRIAMVIEGSSLVAHRLMTGVFRRAMAFPQLQVRRFYTHVLDHKGIDQLLGWQPDALIVFCDDTILLKKIRTALPRSPMLAMNSIPKGVVDLTVVGNSIELISLSITHFRDNGLSNLALFFAGNQNQESADKLAGDFRQYLRGHTGTVNVYQHSTDTDELQCTPSGAGQKRLKQWLKSLPKPVGILCPSEHDAAYLIRVCMQLKLAIPEKIQVIGSDELDESLECIPHITSVHIPAERIGGTTLQAALKLLNNEPVSEQILRISGLFLVPKGSTGMIAGNISNIPAALAYIDSNAMQGITVDTVFEETQNVSLMTFYRDFKKETGELPASYIRRVRLDHACHLLSTTPLNITQIAETSGFSNSNYFAQVFRREIGVSPSQYRKSHHTNP